MRVVVFGANGKIGSLVVARLLKEGYFVTAFVYKKTTLQSSPKLRIVNGDVRDSSTVVVALKDATHIISALGSWGTKSKDILASGMRTIVPVAEEINIEKLVSLTGADAWVKEEHHVLVSRLLHAFLKLTAKKILSDGEEHIRVLQSSSLNWTVLRSPIMTNKSSKSFIINFCYPVPWQRVYRNHVANALVELTFNNSQDFIRKAPYIH